MITESILVTHVDRWISKAKIRKHITFHCFRHTFAMQLLDKGVDIPTIAFFLGHKFLGSSLTYLHCTKEHLEEVIAKLER
jgi:site-specific recombinase XerD